MKHFWLLLIAALLLSSCTAAQTESSSVLSTELSTAELSESKKEQLCAEAKKLLLLDSEVTAIFAAQSLKDFAIGAQSSSLGEYLALSDSCKYKSFSEVEALLDSTYSENSNIKARYLSYPPYGKSALRKTPVGDTEISLVYKSPFLADASGGTVSFLGASDGCYSFQFNSSSLVCSFKAEETAQGLRLLDSLLFIDEDGKTSTDINLISLEDAGSANSLTGVCTVINIFVSTPDFDWTVDEKHAVKNRVDAACKFLKEQSELYGVKDLEFEFAEGALSFGKNVPSAMYGETWVKELAAENGSLEAISKSLCTKENSVMLFHVNTAGRSFSVPCKKNRGEYYEYALMYHSDYGEFKSCAASYAHELLHAFGAVDLYNETLTARGDSLAALYFSGDIMRIVPDNLLYASVGALTAKLVGWTAGLHGQLRELLNECIIN